MTTRVLSSEEGRTSIARMQTIIADGLAGQLQALRAEGNTLSDPNVWDGLEATRFRSSTWPEAAQALTRCVEAVEQLRVQVAAINQNIMAAGGNG
jgi:uncharacterized protein YukE